MKLPRQAAVGRLDFLGARAAAKPEHGVGILHLGDSINKRRGGASNKRAGRKDPAGSGHRMNVTAYWTICQEPFG
jgi:hypothetical protein